MSLQNVILGIGVIVALTLGIVGISKPATVVQKEVTAGAVTNNMPTDPFYAQGGVTSKVSQFNSTTTVACAIQNPLGATTTFSQIAFLVPVGTTTTTVLGIATSTNANRFATSTALNSTTLAAGAQGQSSYRPTTNNDVLGPTDWVYVGYGAGTTLPTVAQNQRGFCSVMFNNLK